MKAIVLCGVLVAFLACFPAVPAHTGALDPPGPPASTMVTLTEIHEKIIEVLDKVEGGAGIPRTGQATSYRTGDDGAHRKGVAWPEPRFEVRTNVVDGVDHVFVEDRLTGLMWVRAPHALDGNGNTMSWEASVDYCHALEFAHYDDWRLPNVRELFSILDYGRIPRLPEGHPFTLQISQYWSSTTDPGNTDVGMLVHFGFGTVNFGDKEYSNYAWPVRGGP